VRTLGSGGPSTFQLYHFNPVDGDSIFLRNFGIDLRNHTELNPKTTPTSLPDMLLKVINSLKVVTADGVIFI
jgi:hypothetical protein